MVICLEQGADLHMAQLMPLPLTVSCFSKIQIGFTFLVAAHPGSPGKRAIKRVCVCVLQPALRIVQAVAFSGVRGRFWSFHPTRITLSEDTEEGVKSGTEVSTSHICSGGGVGPKN